MKLFRGCLVCGKEFGYYKSALAVRSCLYCSVACSNKATGPTRRKAPLDFKPKHSYDLRCLSLDGDKFWSRVPKVGNCWEWPYFRNLDGYGITGKNKLVHRVAYVLSAGDDDIEGYVICHHCDNPSCVRPDHLFKGTHADNQADKLRKGRALRGHTHPRASMTEDDARELHRLASLGVTDVELSKKYGLSIGGVFSVRSGTSWKHLNLEPVMRVKKNAL